MTRGLRTWRLLWIALTATLLASALTGCCGPEPTPPQTEQILPPLPVRPRPRASLPDLGRWVDSGEVDAIVGELLRERDYSDELVRRGRWAR